MGEYRGESKWYREDLRGMESEEEEWVSAQEKGVGEQRGDDGVEGEM